MKDYKEYSKEDLQRIISFYKFKKTAVDLLLEAGLKVHNILPFLFAGLLSLYGYKTLSKPYVVENSKEISSDINNQIELLSSRHFIYSTSWKAVQHSHYERTEIVYELKNDINLQDAEKIISMSEDDLKEAFSIVDVRSITKENKEDDYIYNTDMILIPDVSSGSDKALVRTKMHNEDKSLIIFLICGFLGGFTLKRTENILSASYIYHVLTDKREELDEIYKENILDLIHKSKNANSYKNKKMDNLNKKVMILQKNKKNVI